MDYILSSYTYLRDFYNGCLTKADPRVADWLLMQSFTPTWILTGLYLLTVVLGLHVMRSRPAFDLRLPLVVYNFALVALNFHIFKELFTATWKLGYNYSCQPVDYSDNPDELRIARALWWYYFSKCIEFLDTLFFVLRKKNGQVSFLHVYHHATMFPIWWIGVKWVPGGQSFFGAMINSFIHVIMYTYYGMSAIGPHVQKYLWWKRYLTTIQLIQFVAGITHAFQSLYVDCSFPQWMQWALVAYGFSILVLFLNFYFHAYIRKRPRESSSRSSKIQNGQHNGTGNNKIDNYAVSNGRTKKSKKAL